MFDTSIVSTSWLREYIWAKRRPQVDQPTGRVNKNQPVKLSTGAGARINTNCLDDDGGPSLSVLRARRTILGEGDLWINPPPLGIFVPIYAVVAYDSWAINIGIVKDVFFLII